MEDYQKRFVLNMLSYAVQKDVDIDVLCRLSGCSLTVIKNKTGAALSPQQLDDLWRKASDLSNDPLFGLHFGESMKLPALGVVGGIIQHAATIGEAVMRAAEFMHLVTNLFGMEVQQSNGTFTIRFTPTGEHQKEFPFVFRQMMDLCMVFAIYELDGLVLAKIKPVKVSTGFDISAFASKYERVLRCKPVYIENTYVLEFDDVYWNEPIITANYEMQGVLLQKANTMAGDFQQSRRLKERISDYLHANAYLGVPSLDDLAANFNASARSLQRRLQDEGVTYQELANEVRKSLAMHYVKAGTYQMKEISYLLGYNELSAFTRAFKRWTGTTPAHYVKISAN